MTSSESVSELVRRTHLTLEPLHVVGYASPNGGADLEALGLTGSQFYVGVRSAPMGMAAPEVVTAAFYNFAPRLIGAAIPTVWELTAPQALYDVRHARVDAYYRRALGDDVVESLEMVEAAGLAREAALALRGEGRALFAGHVALPWPESPHLQLFHAQTLLREHRGDGHIAALVLSGLDGLAALITHGCVDEHGFVERVARSSRGWTDDEWVAGFERTRELGLTDGDNRATDALREFRASIEAQTDAAAAAPYVSLGLARTERLAEIVKPWSQAIGAEMLNGLTAVR